MTRLGPSEFFIDWGATAAYQVAWRHRSRVLALTFRETLPRGLGLEEWAQFSFNHSETHLWHLAFDSVPDVSEPLITGKEREYLSWLIKNEAPNPTAITDDDINKYAPNIRKRLG